MIDGRDGMPQDDRSADNGFSAYVCRAQHSDRSKDSNPGRILLNMREARKSVAQHVPT